MGRRQGNSGPTMCLESTEGLAEMLTAGHLALESTSTDEKC